MSVNIDPDIVLPIRPFFRVRPFLSISRNPSDVTFRLFFFFVWSSNVVKVQP